MYIGMYIHNIHILCVRINIVYMISNITNNHLYNLVFVNVSYLFRCTHTHTLILIFRFHQHIASGCLNVPIKVPSLNNHLGVTKIINLQPLPD